MAESKHVVVALSLPAVSEAEIKAYEERTGISLPTEYRTFLLSTNGGVPSPQQMNIPNTTHSVLIGYLYGIGNNRVPGDLEFEFHEQEDDLPEGFLPIGHDPGGNAFLLGTKGKHRGTIYFWDRRGLLSTTTSAGNTYLLAANITDLLNSLY